MTVLAQSNLSAGTFTPTPRFAGSADVLNKPMLIGKVGAGAALKAGTVLGRLTTGGKLVPSISGASDGSQLAVAILVEPVSTVAGDVTAAVYLAGEFNLDWLDFDVSYDTEAKKLDAFGASGSIVVRKLGYSG